MKPKSIITLILCIILLPSLCACDLFEEEKEETLKTPPFDSLVEYRISEDEYILMIYDDYFENYGEWIRGDEVTRVVFNTDEDYWGLFAARYGIKNLCVRIKKLEAIYDSEDRFHGYATEKELAYTDEGYLNSKTLTMSESGETLTIQSITVTENYEGSFDWAPPDWKEFCTANEGERFVIREADLECDAATLTGTWKTGGVDVPVRIQFDEWYCKVHVFDVSGDEDREIFFGSGYLEDGVFVIDSFGGDMIYTGAFTEVRMLKLAPDQNG